MVWSLTTMIEAASPQDAVLVKEERAKKKAAPVAHVPIDFET